MTDLANTYYTCGSLSMAEPLYKRCLYIRTASSGREYEATLSAVGDLIDLCNKKLGNMSMLRARELLDEIDKLKKAYPVYKATHMMMKGMMKMIVMIMMIVMMIVITMIVMMMMNKTSLIIKSNLKTYIYYLYLLY